MGIGGAALRRVGAVVLAVAWVSGAVSGAGPASAARSRYPNDHRLRFDQIQIVGTHNSYHRRPPPPFDLDPSSHYEHPPLTTQLDDLGVRSFELDVYNRTDLPVFHSVFADTVSTCPSLSACLGELATWSRAHPRHVPLVVLVEPKDLPTSPNPTVQQSLDGLAATQGLMPWDAAGLDRVDRVVRAAFGTSLVTPDDVRGRARTLRDAVVRRGWPTLGRMRGSVVTVLLTEGPSRDLYLGGRSSLRGRPMFAPVAPGHDAAAVVKLDVPDPAAIRRLVRKHFLVRTRADAFLQEARANDSTRATNALTSGAQVVSTDFPNADPAIGPYEVRVGRATQARCNPVTAPLWCRTRDLERQ